MKTIEPKGIVIHSMAQYLVNEDGKTVHARDFLASIGLSVHAFVEPDGSVVPMKPAPQKASHAGKSKWNGLEYLNSHYLGVELLVEGVHSYDSFIAKIKDPETFTEAQYTSLANLCAEWMKEYPLISLDTVARHSDVSGVEVRPEAPKKDPGSGFNWLKFRTMLSIRELENY